jgi:hypothetical protein
VRADTLNTKENHVIYDNAGLIIMLSFIGLLLIYGLYSIVVKPILAEKKDRQDAAKTLAQSEYEARQLQQLRDTQLNHGNRIYNWLKAEIAKRPEWVDIKIGKIENNGGKFSILVEQLWGDVRPAPVLQLSFDFSRSDFPRAHIHYGAYGADAYFAVLSHSPFYALDRFVINEIESCVKSKAEGLASLR